MKKDICIISVGFNGREIYSEYAKNLKNICNILEYPNFIWINEFPPESPTHNDVHYAFKPYAFNFAKEQGYKKILWLDSKCYPTGNLEIINNFLENDGYFFVNEEHDIGTWCKDDAYQYLNIDKESCFNLPQIAGKHFGLNLNFDISNIFLEKYFNIAKTLGKEVFHGSWTNLNNEVSTDPRVKGHRHDQIVASVLVHQLGLKISSIESGLIQWRDSWKFFPTNYIEPEILVDGYNHGTHMCKCEVCMKVWKEVEQGKRIVPSIYLR
jgi:hypothetical protein